MSKKRKKGKKVQYPYFVHADPLKERTAFPSHTHGLTEVGWPEFFIDPLAFGGEGNCQRINAIWEYLRKPENKHKLDEVLSGKIIEITDRDLVPGRALTHVDTYCLREVLRSFEGVKLAYPYQAEDESVPMRFVQIWVKGDDFALHDEYYKGGVRW
jgi:hypothetical protein